MYIVVQVSKKGSFRKDVQHNEWKLPTRLGYSIHSPNQYVHIGAVRSKRIVSILCHAAAIVTAGLKGDMAARTRTLYAL